MCRIERRLIPSTPEERLALLTGHRTLGDAPRSELEWIAAHGTLERYSTGDIMINHLAQAETLEILITGRIAVHVNRGSGVRNVYESHGGDVSGLLPFSRMVHSPGDVIAEEETVSVSLSRGCFPDLIRESPTAIGIMVHVMLDRARRSICGGADS